MPRTLTSQSRPGSSTEATTLAWAARWKIGCAAATSSTTAVSAGEVDDVELAQVAPRADPRGVAGGEVVDHRDRVAVLEQGVDHVRADEPGTAGDDRA